MYNWHQGQQAIHQDIVNDGLRRSERRRMLNEVKAQVNSSEKARSSRTTVRSLVSVLLGVTPRP